MATQTVERTTTDATREIISYDPATGAEVGRAPALSAAEVARAVARARAAQTAWGALSYRARGRVVLRVRELVLAELDKIATLIAREAGKPVAEAIAMELVPTLDLMQFFARRTERLLRPEKIDIGQYGLMGRSSRIVYRPLGVVGIISPWNFPWAIPVGEVVMALMAGNGVVLKPSELTPLVGLEIADVFKRAGVPEGLFSVVTGDGATGAALVEASVDKIMFTGSVATGKRVGVAAAERLMPCVLELGGKDPMLVLEDADVEAAARAAVWGAFANSGQACASVERCYVHERRAPEFLARVVELTQQLKQDAGIHAGADIGAMSSARPLQIGAAHVEDASGHGAGQRSALHTRHRADALGRHEAERLGPDAWARRTLRACRGAAHTRQPHHAAARPLVVQLHGARRRALSRSGPPLHDRLGVADLAAAAADAPALARTALSRVTNETSHRQAGCSSVA